MEFASWHLQVSWYNWYDCHNCYNCYVTVYDELLHQLISA
jgi:hypothetical protein